MYSADSTLFTACVVYPMFPALYFGNTICTQTVLAVAVILMDELRVGTQWPQQISHRTLEICFNL